MCLKVVTLLRTAIHYLSLKDDIFLSYQQVVTGQSRLHYIHGIAPFLVITALLLYVHRFTHSLLSKTLRSKKGLASPWISFIIQVMFWYVAMVSSFLTALFLQENVYMICRNYFLYQTHKEAQSLYRLDAKPSTQLDPIDNGLLVYTSVGTVMLLDACGVPDFATLVRSLLALVDTAGQVARWVVAAITSYFQQMAERQVNVLIDYIAGKVVDDDDEADPFYSGVPGTEWDNSANTPLSAEEEGCHDVDVTAEVIASAGDAPAPLDRWSDDSEDDAEERASEASEEEDADMGSLHITADGLQKIS